MRGGDGQTGGDAGPLAANYQGGGGGGGAGGYGAVVTTATSQNTNTGQIIGGNGAAGGGGAVGGAGGDGGVGVQFGVAGAMLTNSGSITGGVGGAEGFHSNSGQGGAGVVGSGLNINNAGGTISGGFANNGTGQRADAITFTGGFNTLYGTGTLNGGIGVTGTLSIIGVATPIPGGGISTADVTLSNVIHDYTAGSGSLVFSDSGKVTLTAANTYTGSTVVTGATNLTGASTLALLGAGSIVQSRSVGVDGTFDISGATNDTTIKALTGSGNVVLGTHTLNVTGASPNSLFSGVIAGMGGFTVSGGNVVLTGTSTYTGTTTIGSGAALQLGNGGTTGTLAANSAITLGAGGTLAVNHSDVLTLSNAISGAGGLIQGGTSTSTLILSGVDSYTGATAVSAGTMFVNTALTGGGAVSVAAGALLGGTGTIAGTVTVNGTVSGGQGVGTLATGSLILRTGATFHEDVASSTAADHINVTGTVSLAGLLDFSTPADFAAGIGQSLTLIDNDGTADVVTGRFTSLHVNGATVALNANDTFSLQGHTYLIDYRGGDGNDVALRDVTPAPQPPTGGATITTNGTSGNDITTSDPSTVTAAVGTNAIDTVYYSGSQPLTLPGNIENVVLSGQGGNTAITGNGGNNAFVVKSGSWHIEGGGGSDVLVFATELSGHTIQLVDANNYVVTGPEGTETVSHVAGIGFAHDQITFDFSTNAAEVVRLYDATLHRAADIGGGTNALAQLNGGVTLAQLSQAFLNSSEGQLQYAPAQTNHQYVDALYANVLHRAPDAGGEANWEAALNAGTSRGAVLAAFSEAPEHAAFVQFNQVVGIAVDHPIIG